MTKRNFKCGNNLRIETVNKQRSVHQNNVQFPELDVL